MIIRLHIENFALIESLDLDLDAGLNVLTGETGAGKSIIIDAMGVINGAAGLQEYIRSGAEKALVEALFEITDYKHVADKLEELGLNTNDTNLLLTREINKNGKNTCRVNGRPVTLSMYRDVGELLIDIYGQHQQQSLLRKEKHLVLLDSFGGQGVKELLNPLSKLVSEHRRTKEGLYELSQDESERIRKIDMFSFQLQEIDEARLEGTEEKSLLEERVLLANAEKLAFLAEEAYNNLYRGSSPKSPALESLHEALQALKELAGIDGTMREMANQLKEAYYQVEDCARELGRYQDLVCNDPQRLTQIEDRLDKIKRIKRKYGSTIEEVLVYRQEIAVALDKINSSETEINGLGQRLAEIEKEYRELAGELSFTRRSVAEKVQQEICRQLVDLNMPHVEFCVSFAEKDEVNGKGNDDIEFLISPNPGEPLRPLAKIASGGEISRIMLAIKAILAEVDEIPTLIFDEVDAGLGGHTVTSVAQKLAAIGVASQVICVTHSPQIASYADKHYRIEKETIDGRTVTKVGALNREERITELARMFGGNNITATTLQNAKEMLEHAQKNRII